MNYGERIKQRRLELGYSVDELAHKIGKSRATIYRYENGSIEDLPITIMEPLARALETTPADLMGWKTKASARITLYNVYCETEDESKLVLTYRELSDIGRKKVSSYTDKLLEIETADLEVVAAHERTDIEITDEMRKHDNDIMGDENF